MTGSEIIRFGANISKRIQDAGCWAADFIRIAVLEELMIHYPPDEVGLTVAAKRELHAAAIEWAARTSINRKLDQMNVPKYEKSDDQIHRRLQWLHEEHQKVTRALEERRQQVARMQGAVAKFLNANGHDLCHENRREMAEACGVHALAPEKPATVAEFDAGCKKYQAELYGTSHTDVEIQRLAAEMKQIKGLPQGDWLASLLVVRCALDEELNQRGARFLTMSGWVQDDISGVLCWSHPPTGKRVTWPAWAEQEYLSIATLAFTTEKALNLQQRIQAWWTEQEKTASK